MLLITLDPPNKLRVEGEELMIEHYREMKLPGVLSLNWPALGKMYRDGSLFPFGVRKGGELIGYAIVVVSPMLFNQSMKWGWCEALYLDPAHRGQGHMREMTEFVEGALKPWGVHILSFSVSPRAICRGAEDDAKVGELLGAMAYAQTAEIWSKRLEG